MLQRFVCLVVFGVLAQVAPAQCQTINASGCPSATSPSCGGSTQIGSMLQLQCAPSSGMPGIVIGQRLTTPVPLPQSITCSSATCTVACTVLVALTGATANLRIPNDPVLVGLSLCAQCVDVRPSVPCVDLSRALLITVS